MRGTSLRGVNGTEQEWGVREEKDKLKDQRIVKECSLSMVVSVIVTGVDQVGQKHDKVLCGVCGAMAVGVKVGIVVLRLNGLLRAGGDLVRIGKEMGRP